MVLIAAAAAVGILALQAYSTSKYRLSNRVQASGLDAQALDGLAWVAQTDIDFVNFPYGAPDRESKFAGDSAALDALLTKADSTSADLPPNVRTVVDDYLARVHQIAALLGQGKTLDAFPILNDLTPRLTNVIVTVNDEATRYRSQAETAYLVTSVASLMVFVGAVVGLLFLAAQNRRTGRRLEIEASERDLLRRSEARFRPLVQNSTDIIAVIDEELNLKYMSPSAERLLGWKTDDGLNVTLNTGMHPDDVPILKGFLENVAARAGYSASTEARFLDKDGQPIDVELVGTNLLGDPDVLGLVLNIRDVSERKAMEEQLRHQAFHDSLTGLGNRLQFTDRLQHALTRTKRDGEHKSLALLYLDLDHFKDVNDEMGHSAGDELLTEAAQRILRCIRVGDTAARLGGDEFAVLLEDTVGVDEARHTAGRILTEINRPFSINSELISLSASLGIVAGGPSIMTAEEMIRNADVAMYDAKNNGRNCAHLYEPNMHASMMERLRLTSELQTAVEGNELEVYYQPLFDIHTRSIRGFEALVRWNHPRRGLLLPSEFVPAAEETGAIIAIGQIVLREACRQAKEWQAAHPGLPTLTMNVNVSAKQIQKPGFVDLVVEVLAESAIPPTSLVLEITESVLIAQPELVMATLGQIKALGVRIALDDFGTGYSSLNYLRSFPIDSLKIDKSFIEGLSRSDKDQMLVRTMIDLGGMLDLDIVAEGIESQQQLALLEALHCNLGQGFLFAQPLTSKVASELLGAGDWDSFQAA